MLKDEPLKILFLTTNQHLVKLSAKKAKKTHSFHTVSAFNQCFVEIPKKQINVLIHDWDSFQSSQNAFFENRIFKTGNYGTLIRIVTSADLTPTLFAHCHDYAIRTLITHASLTNNLNNELIMATSASLGVLELQKKIWNLKSRDFNQSHFDAIDEMITEAYAQYAHDPLVRLEFANLCLKKNDLLLAQKISERLIQEDSNNVRAINLCARVAMKQGRLDDGILLLENANLLSPYNVDRLVSLGDSFYTKGNLTKAKHFFSESLLLDPRNGDGAVGLASVLVDENNLSGALEIFLGSFSEDETASFFNNYGIKKIKEGNLSQALRLYETALQGLKLPEMRAKVFYNIGLALRKFEHFSEAEIAFKEALNHNSLEEKARLNLINISKIQKVS